MSRLMGPHIYPIWVMAIALLLIPFSHGFLIWILAFFVGFLSIFAFAAWTAVPGGYASIRSEDIATAEGLMLTLVAVGGFVVPVVFGSLVAGAGYTAGWVFLAAVSFAFSFLNYAAREPGSAVKLH